VTVDYYYVNSGLRGDFVLPGWEWSLNASYSKSEGEYKANRILKETAGDATEPRPSDGLYAGPNYNPFDPAFLAGNYSQATFDLLTDYPVGNTTYDQTIVQGVLSGDLLQLPAGPLGVAVGAEWRNFSLDDTPSLGEQNDEYWGVSSANPTRGEDTVQEAFVEVNAPLLRGQPFIEELTFDGSYRAFEYDSYGSDSVWKAGLNWQVIPSVRLRGTKGTSYRAPALYELYLDELTAFQDQLLFDPCVDWGNSTNQNVRTNCASEGIPDNYNGAGTDAQIISSGGAGLLEAETSEASTLGVIWTPDFLNLSVAIDYFDITINNQVTQLGETNILLGCYSAPVFPNAFCDLFDRNFVPGPGQFNVTTVIDNYINVSQQATHGIDYTIRYEHEFDFGDLSIELSATQTMEDVILLFGPGVSSGFNSNDFLGTIGDPEWVADGDIQLRRGDFTYSWFIDYIGPTDNEVFFPAEVDYLGRPARLINTTDDWLSHDFSVRWRGDRTTITGGILNAFDAQAPVISANAGQRLQNHALAATQYDLRGRTFFVRLGYEF
jgi:iron complex outermembrane receptor protein